MKSMIVVVLLLTCAVSAPAKALPQDEEEANVVDAEVLQRWDVAPEEYDSMEPDVKKRMDQCVRTYEKVRRAQVMEIERFVEPKNLNQFIDPTSKKPTQNGLELLERLARERASLSAPLKSAAERLNLGLAAAPNFDGGIERPAANLNGNYNNKETDRVGPVLGAGAGLADAAAVSKFLDAARLGLGGAGGAASLGEQALAAAAAGDYSTAQELGDQASKTGDKALHAFHMGKFLTGIGGAFEIADGARNIYNGIMQALAGNKSCFNETTVIGTIKVAGGILQEVSLAMFMAAPYFLIAGILLYGGAWIYQHRKKIKEFFINLWKGFKALFQKNGSQWESRPTSIYGAKQAAHDLWRKAGRP